MVYSFESYVKKICSCQSVSRRRRAAAVDIISGSRGSHPLPSIFGTVGCYYYYYYYYYHYFFLYLILIIIVVEIGLVYLCLIVGLMFGLS